MRTIIRDLLSADDIKYVKSVLESAQFEDGNATAGPAASVVKNNLQAVDKQVLPACKLVNDRMLANKTFYYATRPVMLSPIRFSRYDVGMGYGSHLDAPLSENGRFRWDVAFTLFLNPPVDYDGGELVVESTGESFKFDAGTLVVYPATSLHHVNVVTRGVRLVAIGWVMCLIRDAAKRELVYELETAQNMMLERNGKTAELDLVIKARANLLRMWAGS